MIGDEEAFILANTRLLPVPHAPEISLQVADEATVLWQKTEEELGELGLPPPFWAFAWAGGQALARYVLDHPTSVSGRKVLDFASGSGLVAIAAAKAGASLVEACDIDRFACTAMRINASRNGVDLKIISQDLVGHDAGWEVVLAGDIFYQRDIAERLTPWFGVLARRGAEVLVGDPGRAYLPHDRLQKRAQYEVPVTRALEDAEIKRTAVWRFA